MGWVSVTMPHQEGKRQQSIQDWNQLCFYFTISNIWSGFSSRYNQTKYIQAGFRLITVVRIVLACHLTPQFEPEKPDLLIMNA
jgi:hypothetical protein